MKPASELFIVLSNLCNFNCAHCVTSSSLAPKDQFTLKKEELAKLVDWIRNEPSIKRVHFSGGEPTLHLDLIKSIQSELPNLSYAMTSNGWYGNRFEQIFDSIKLDLIFFSFDRFHKPFITINTLIKSKTSQLYTLNDKPIGIFGIWINFLHPLLNSKVNHIGAIGYDSTQVSKNQAQVLKRHWMNLIDEAERASLLEVDQSSITTARIDLFNLPSQSLFNKFGFKITGLELVPL